ncbi:MAG: ATP-binding protein [Thermoleophilaceae bacterium]
MPAKTKPQPLVARQARQLVLEGLEDSRIVFVMGARQVGKSTLTREIAANEHPATVLSFDEKGPREAASEDPTGFVAGLSHPVLIDEVQRVPDVLLAIKDDVDADTSPGRYLLTGSANVLASRKVKDALTGRIDVVRLWPFSQSELEGGASNLVDMLFSGKVPQITGAVLGRDAFADRVVAGGYRVARARAKGRRRDRWFANYVDTTLDRDLRDIAEAYKLEEMPQLLRLLAASAANIVNYRELASKLELEHKTVKRYIRLLETIFLVRTLRAWRPGLVGRETAKPKAYIVDAGLLAHLIGADATRVAKDDQVTGKILENFVAMELLRLSEWSELTPRLFHYAYQRGEIDVVMEARSGDLVGVEVKAAATVGSSDWRHLARLRDSKSQRFKAGVMLYTGEQTVPLGDRLWALPISALWA